MNTQNTETQVYYEPCKTAALIAKLEAQLEKAQRQLRMSERTVEHLFRDRDQLTAQRDELLAALKEAIQRERNAGLAADTATMNRWQSVIARCDAANLNTSDSPTATP